jgi:hypothetical protein
MILVLKAKALWFVGLALALAALYMLVVRLTAKPAPSES